LKEGNISGVDTDPDSMLAWIKEKSNFKTVWEDTDTGAPSVIYNYVSNQNNNFWNPSLIAAINYFTD